MYRYITETDPAPRVKSTHARVHHQPHPLRCVVYICLHTSLIAPKVILTTLTPMTVPMTVRRHPGVSRRLAYTTFLPTSWPSARAQRYLPRLLKCRISTSSAGEDVELFNELRGLVVKVQARKRLEDGSMKNFVVSFQRIVDSDIRELRKSVRNSHAGLSKLGRLKAISLKYRGKGFVRTILEHEAGDI